MDPPVMHGHIMHGHVMHGHVMHAHIMLGHAIHANDVNCMVHVRINSDLPTVPIGPKPVEQRNANSTVSRSELQRKLACH
jgi:hypothetical protein